MELSFKEGVAPGSTSIGEFSGLIWEKLRHQDDQDDQDKTSLCLGLAQELKYQFSS